MTRAARAQDFCLKLLKMTENARLRVEQAMRPAQRCFWRRLHEAPLHLKDMEAEHEGDLPEAYAFLNLLWSNKALALQWPADDPQIEIAAAVPGEVLSLGVCRATDVWQLSRFAFVHAGEDGGLVAETPLVAVSTRILDAKVVAAFGSLATAKTAAQLQSDLGLPNDGRSLEDLLALLACAGLVQRCDGDGKTEESLRPEIAQWEAHDLLFHMRSRQGRHDHPMGASFRFRGHFEPQPAVKANPWQANAMPLPVCDLSQAAATDLPFSVVLESRRSIRAMDFARPITLRQIADFLFRTARVRHQFQTDIGEFTSRPYPNGGASYEFELYLTVNACDGLARGFYYYDPKAHTLSLVRTPNEDTEGLLNDAWVSAARQCRPQVLVTIASRFHRVSWKYSGMAYAAQLKNVGALYQTFYLVTTAMNLAGCGLGLGDAARFSRLTGLSFFQEGSIGEFMLGSRA